MWAIVTIVVLIILIVVLLVLTQYSSTTKLDALNETNLYRPIGGDPDKSPTQKLSCPVGRSIRVLDAWYEVYDPSQQFLGADNTLSLYGTDDDGKVVGPIDSNGNVQGSLGQMWNKSSTAQHLSSNGNRGIYSNVCTYKNTEGTEPGSNCPGQCRIINALPTLAAIANGKNEVVVTLAANDYSNTPASVFPSPCLGSVPGKSGTLNFRENQSDYDSLKKFLPGGSPYISNYKNVGSSIAQDPSNPTGVDYTFGQQGYYLHGIYTCVPDDDA